MAYGGPDGSGQRHAHVRSEQDGDKLSGTYSCAFGNADVRGTVNNDAVVVEFDADFGGAKGAVRYAGSWTATRR
jgi:hypothetical protein